MYLYLLFLMFYTPTRIYFQEKKLNKLKEQPMFDVENKYNLTSDEIETLEEISQNIYKHKMLKILENENVSPISKLEYIHTFQDESISINITNGGLYNDFNFQI